MAAFEMRMYFFVNYQFIGIQKGIQSTHAFGEFMLKYCRNNPDHIMWEYLEKHKTVIVLDGGTSNNHPDRLGTMNLIENSLMAYNSCADHKKIDYSIFYEEDIQDALTAICFICDERVWDYEGYPEFKQFILDYDYENIRAINMSYDELKINFPKEYIEWETIIMGGYKNVFLRELISGKKLA